MSTLIRALSRSPLLASDAKFEESKHPRDHGQFASTAGASGKGTDKTTKTALSAVSSAGLTPQDKTRAMKGQCASFALALHDSLAAKGIKSELVQGVETDAKGRPEKTDPRYMKDQPGNTGYNWRHIFLKVGDQYVDADGQQTIEGITKRHRVSTDPKQTLAAIPVSRPALIKQIDALKADGNGYDRRNPDQYGRWKAMLSGQKPAQDIAEQPRDANGQFASVPGGKTEHVGFSDREAKKARKNAHEHAAQLRAKGHEGVKVTKRHQNATVAVGAGRGVGVISTYTTHHGFPAKPAQDDEHDDGDLRRTLFDLLAYENWWNAYDARVAKDAEFHEADHPRDDDGKFGSGGGGHAALKAPSDKPSSTGAPRLVPLNAGAKLPEHIASLKIPPAWTAVHYSPNPGSHLLVVGRDTKGRPVSIYAESHHSKQSAAKFARVKELAAKFDKVMAQNEAAKKDPAKRDAADALELVMKMGIRPGSDRDTGAEHKGYGATTLEGRHVRVSPNGNVRLQFVPGKKHGQEINLPVTDKKLAAMLVKRKEKAGNGGRLFGDLGPGDLRRHSHDMDGGSFSTKDFRTHIGTETATNEVADRDAPANPTQYKRAVREVAKVVAERLGNTPTIALSSYISPVVFADWRASAGV